jgi:ferredoxin
MVPNPLTPNQAMVIDEQLCKGCNKCVEVCHSDVLVKSPDNGWKRKDTGEYYRTGTKGPAPPNTRPPVG